MQTQAPTQQFRFVNTLAALNEAMEEADAFLEKHDASPKFAYAARLAFEELVTNIIKYGYDDENEHTIEVTLALESPAVMTLVDDGHKFNPLTDAPQPALDGEIEDRPIGGLGLHMIQQMGMQLQYTRESNQNILRVVFPS